MIHKLTDEVWFGNWQAPVEAGGQVRCVINVAHSFSKRRGRNVYWANMEQLPWNNLYFRIALKDRMDITAEYAASLAACVDSAVRMQKLPILTHCQMGGHRGPSSAMFVAWHLNGRTRVAFENLHKRCLELVPGLIRGHNYYHSILDYIDRHCV